jgi:hypothetical protein
MASLQIINPAAIIVRGDLVFDDYSQMLLSHDNITITVTGCIIIKNGSSLGLDKSSNQTANAPSGVAIVSESGCITGKFDHSVEINNCSNNDTVVSYEAQSISVVFIPNDSQCIHKSAKITDYTVMIAVLVVVGLVIVVIAAVISVKIKKIRKLIAPHHYRTTYVFEKNQH